MKRREILPRPLKWPPLLYLVVGFKVGDGPPDVIHQRVDKIFTPPHRPPAIWAGRAQISTTEQKENNHTKQRDIWGPRLNLIRSKPGKQSKSSQNINTRCDAYQQH